MEISLIADNVSEIFLINKSEFSEINLLFLLILDFVTFQKSKIVK